jgi:hypothetical protein
VGELVGRKLLRRIIMKKSITESGNGIFCSEVSFSGGKLGDIKQKKTFTLVVDVDMKEVLLAAASSWVIELQTLRDKDGALEKVRNLPNTIKVSEIAGLIGKGTRQAMSEEAMVAKLIGCDISKVTPEMVALVKAMGQGLKE